MIGKRMGAVIAAIVLLAALAGPAAAQATTGKIKVSVENASLRDKPSMDGEILEEKIPLGTVFNIEKKAGEWYEVKFQSTLGVMITGYIHEMYVEVLPAEPAAKPVAKPVEPAKPQTTTTPPVTQPVSRIRVPGGPKFEIGLGFGMGFGSFLPASSTYNHEWSWEGLDSVQERGTLNHKMKSPMGLGFSLAYYFSGGFGLKLRVDMNFKQSLDASSSNYLLSWRWWTAVTDSDQGSWGITGDMSVMPISLDFVYKFVAEGMFQPYVNAGVSYFIGSANIQTNAGRGVSWIDGGWQYIDYFPVPLEINDASLSSIGFNAGLGADIFFSPSIALSLDAAYFIGKTASLEWTVNRGTYYTVYYDQGFNVPADYLRTITESLGNLEVKTSFFKIQAGLKIGI